jgi:hypothetical protein
MQCKSGLVSQVVYVIHNFYNFYEIVNLPQAKIDSLTNFVFKNCTFRKDECVIFFVFLYKVEKPFAFLLIACVAGAI